MNQSETIGKLATALGAFQKDMPTVSQDATNPFFHSSYATLAGLVGAAGPLLPAHGLSVTQITEGAGAVTTMLMHISGEYISGTLELNPVKNDPQGRGSAITYARRYSYASILGLVTDKDDDGNAGSKPPANKPPKRTTKPPASPPSKPPAKTSEPPSPPALGKAYAKDQQEKLISRVMADSRNLALNYDRKTAIRLIQSACKSAGLPTPLNTQVDFDLATDISVGSLAEIATQPKG